MPGGGVRECPARARHVQHAHDACMPLAIGLDWKQRCLGTGFTPQQEPQLCVHGAARGPPREGGWPPVLARQCSTAGPAARPA